MPVMPRDCYRILGVPRTASPDEIRAAFVRLVRFHHPDATGAMPQRLDDVRQAYHRLTDPIERAAHDAALDQAERAHGLRQRRIQRRLRHYDRHHPIVPRPPRRRMGWRSTLLLTAGFVVLAQVAFDLFA